MAVERLSSSDLLMLWSDEIWPQEVAALAFLDGSGLIDAEGRFRIRLVRQAVAGRLHVVPRLRQVIYTPAPGQGGPLWVDDGQFDIANHVRVQALDADADEDLVLRTVEQLCRRRLDRSRPLWELRFLPGLPDRRVALYLRMHHAMADGMAAVAVLGGLLDLTPETAIEAGPPWEARPHPDPAELRDDEASRRAERSASLLSVLGHPIRSIRRAVDAGPALAELVGGQPGPETPLSHVVGPARKLALVRGSLAPIRRTAHENRGTVNDVFLAAIAGGLREWLGSRGVPVDGLVLPVYVPVSLRHGPAGLSGGNEVAQMVVPLPVGVVDPARRLALIAGETAIRKTRARPSVAKLPHTGYAGRLMVKILKRQRVNVTTANLPGPIQPLYMAGAPVLEVFPLLPLIGPVTLGIGALSYAGAFNLGLVADAETVPDLQVMAAALDQEMRAMQGEHAPAAHSLSI